MTLLTGILIGLCLASIGYGLFGEMAYKRGFAAGRLRGQRDTLSRVRRTVDERLGAFQ